jgi:hypothetical protein
MTINIKIRYQCLKKSMNSVGMKIAKFLAIALKKLLKLIKTLEMLCLKLYFNSLLYLYTKLLNEWIEKLC